jgi:hypothetical protein
MDNLAFIKICDDNIDRLQTTFPSACTLPEEILENIHTGKVFANHKDYISKRNLLTFWLNAKIEFIKRQVVINEHDSCSNA